MRWKILLFLYFLSVIKASQFPCGPSFIPCEKKSFGVRNLNVDSHFSKMKQEQKKKELSKFISKVDLAGAASSAKQLAEQLFNTTEQDMMKTISEPHINEAELSWFRYTRADQYSKYLSYSAIASIMATTSIMSNVSHTRMDLLPLVDVSGTDIHAICPVGRIEECIAGKYRSYSGHCNNVNHPYQSAVHEPLARLLPPEYDDDISKPRSRSKLDESPLPSASRVAKLFSQTKANDSSSSLFVAQFASFIYDDLAHIASNRLIRESFFSMKDQIPLPCCDEFNTHPECFPIKDLDENGKVTKCVNFARSMPIPRENCTLGPREQGNTVSGFLDGSQIYGSTTEAVNRLRSHKGGRLALRSQTFAPLKAALLQAVDETDGDCRVRSKSQACFLAGSHRANLLPTSAALYTIWYRQHNFIAEKLQNVNPHWNDEKLFQETRRIVIAQLQHIAYSELLPILIGKEAVKRQSLDLQVHGYDSRYDMKIDAAVLNEYASTVGQFFYSMLPGVVQSVPENSRKLLDSINKNFNNPSLLYNRQSFDGLIRSLTVLPSKKPGLHLEEGWNNLFGSGNSDGVNIAAMIVQMGRDHAIPGYVKFREICGLGPITNFAALESQFSANVNISLLEDIYASPDDIDLFVGGLAESPSSGALLGPTLSCLLAKQMEITKRGDRFWYENFMYPAAFTTQQLNEIRKTSMARIVCDNTEFISTIQPNVFMLPDEFGNCPRNCNSTSIESIDFTPFKDVDQQRRLPITEATVEKAIRLGVEQYKRLLQEEGRRVQQELGHVSTKTASAQFAHASLMAPKRESLDIARTAGVLREATKILISGQGLLPNERLPADLDAATLQRLLPHVEVGRIVGNFTPFLGRNPLPKEQCLPEQLPCDHTTKYRSYSGRCNNLQFPQYGSAFEPLKRLKDPAYDDGFDSPRTKSKRGGTLPSARKIANAIHSDSSEEHVKYTHMLMQFGQILDHDMMHSPVSRGPNNTILNCSSCDSPERLSIHCFPIKIEKDDPHFPAKHDNGAPRCMPFARSLLGQLTLGYRNQLNQLTSFLDASYIYGSTDCEARRLRLFNGGKLNFTNLGNFNHEALPQGNQERDCRSHLKNPQQKCFVAGDERSNEQPGLTVLHNILLREHNRIAAQLQLINNFWTDEQLFQEARRINIAQLQHIIFKEWLPVVLGCEIMEKYGLSTSKTGYFEGYDAHCDASISQEMSTSAFRFGHTLIRKSFARMNEKLKNITADVELKGNFNDPSPVYDQKAGHIESLLMGLLGSSSMAFDRHIVEPLRNHLFAKPGGPLTGLDLPAINIQRARDHGVQPYNEYREFCGLRRASSFESLLDTMDAKAVEALRSVYEDVDDIDLFPGIMSERPMKGALVGPSVACFIAEQMRRLKKCDRFYYETSDAMVRFTQDQLAEIRKSSLSKILCANSEYARRIQPNAFLMPDDLTNAPMSCSELPEIDLQKWDDREFCTIDHRIVQRGSTKRITPCVSCTCTEEGPECTSVVVEHCEPLLDDYTVGELQKDPVCVLQCGHLFRKIKT